MISSAVSNGGIGRLLLNVSKTDQYLGLEVHTIYQKARLRELPCVNLGHTLRFDESAGFVERREHLALRYGPRCIWRITPGNKTLDAFGDAAYSDLQA